MIGTLTAHQFLMVAIKVILCALAAGVIGYILVVIACALVVRYVLVAMGKEAKKSFTRFGL